MSTPCVLILKSCTANAFALVRSRMLLFTSSLLEQMGDEEIAAICFHELGHLKESRTEIVMRGIGTKALYPWIFLKPLQHWLNDWIGALVILFATTVIIITFSRYISRKLEVKADSTAKQNEAEGGVYARALERIYQINLMPAVMPKSTTHPSLYDRLIAAGAQPDYARPERPASTSRIYLLCMIGFGLTLGWYLASRS